MQKRKKTALIEAHRKTFFMFCIVLLTSFLPLISGFEFDNVLRTRDSVYTDYPILEIKNAYGLGDTIAEIEILENTDQCLLNCYTIGTITIYQDDTIFNDLDFVSNNNNRKYLNYNVYTESTDCWDVESPIFRQDCSVIDSNLTCTDVIDHYETNEYCVNDWKKYKGKVLPAGSYKWKVEAKKDEILSIDWAFNYKGITNEEVRQYYVWWNAAYGKKRIINITENSANNLVNYSVLLNITYDSDMLNNFSDLVFTDGTETIQLGHWIEKKTDGANAEIWVLVPTLSLSSTESIYMYYNNPAAADTSNPELAFVVYDDFDTFDTNEWDCTGSTCTASGGYLNLTMPTNSYNSALWKLKEYANYMITSRSKSELTYTDGHVFRKNTTALGNNITHRYTMTESTSVANREDIDEWDAAGTKTNRANFAYTDAANTWYIRESFGYFTTLGYRMYSDAGAYLGGVNTTDTTYGSGYAGIFNQGDATKKNTYDWFRVRTYTEPEPTYTVGAEETATTLNVELNTPTNNQKFTNGNILFNCSAYSTDGVLNLTLYIDAAENKTIYNTTAKQNLSISTTESLSDGTHNYSCLAFDVLSSDLSGVFLFSIDSQAPSITINSLNQIYDYTVTGDSITFNWTVTDTNLESCWYEYDGSNNTVVCGDNNATITVDNIAENITLHANDSYGNLASVSTNWGYKIFINSIGYSAVAFESETTPFNINVTYNTTYAPLTAAFYYDDISRTVTTTTNGDNKYFNSSVSIPDISTEQTKNFVWAFDLNGANINSSTYTQTQKPLTTITLTPNECAAGFFKAIAYNFSDEINFSKYNVTVEYNFKYGITNLTALESFGSYTNTNTFNLCVNQSIGNINIGEGIIKYSLAGFTTRDYYELEYTPISNITTINKTLYLLDVGLSTSFILSVTDINQQGVTNAYIFTDRYYPSLNDYKVVQVAKTDINGKSVGFFKTETGDYRFRIIKNNITELITSVQKVVPESTPYTLNFIIGSGLVFPSDQFEALDSYTGTISFNDSTNITTYTYTDTSGNFTTATFKVYSLKGNQSNILICTNTSTSTSTSLTCDFNGYSGIIIASGFITRNGKESVATQEMFLISSARTIYDNYGLYLAILITLTLTLVFIWSPTLMIIAFNVCTIATNFIGLTEYSPIYIAAVMGVSIIVIILLRE